MTKEQEEIIKKNRTILLDLINYIRFDEEKHYTEGEYYKAIEELNEKSVDLLNTVEKQRTEIENKDKIIDLMTEEIAENILNTCPQADYNCDLDCENRCKNDYKKCWKQYFEKRVEECGR